MQNEVLEGFSMSPQQRQLWPLLEDDPGSAYRADCAILIEGSLDRERLAAALREVARRHEVLRTTFQNLPGMTFPVQVIYECSAPPVDERDLSELDPLAKEAAVEKQFAELCRKPFDLQDGPLLRFSLLELSPNKRLLLVNLSALCGDAAGLRNLVQEISRCYAGHPAEDTLGNPMQYADLSEWQNEILAGEYAATGVEFWREQAGGLANTLKLPFEMRPREAPEFDPQFLVSTVTPDLLSKSEMLVRRYETSTAVFLLTCWYVLLWQLSRSPDLVVVVDFDGRGYEELAGALGLFAKHLPIRVQVDGESRFDDLLKEVNELTRAAQRWQEVFTWERVMSPVENGKQLFAAVGFSFAELPATHLAAGLSFSMARQYVCTDRFKIKLSCVQSSAALTTEFHYDPALVSLRQVEDLSRQFHTLLESIAARPSAFLHQLNILDSAERQRLLCESNNTTAATPNASSVQEIFESQAKQHQTDAALIFGDQRLTYHELNIQANRLAHHLRQLGVAPEARVGLCVERSTQMVVGLLGALKAGGAYVPLESDHPRARLMQQLSEARASVLLTQESLLPQFADFAGAVLCLDRDQHQWAAQPEENPTPTNMPAHLVYVLYTSGSTGAPKAVGITHGNLINYAHDTCRRLGAHERRLNFAMVTTLSADLCITSLYGALLSGGCLHLLGYGVATSGAAMSVYMTEHEIDVLKIVPSHLSALTAAGGKAVMPRRYLVVGGEALSSQLAQRWEDLKSGCVIVNEYGPTETTVGSVVYSVKEEDETGAASAPVGRPIANTQVYILDRWMQPVAPGVEGEFYLGGAGVARGYLNSVERTAERFLPHPFAREGGQRLYRTGDVGRCLRDGNLEFIGRIDDQVKVSGYRVELGEIESVLKRHEAMKDALILATEAESGHKRLIAYVVPESGQAPVVAGRERYELPDALTIELRRYLKEHLPSYMVPASFILLDALPLTPNGKVDRHALPRPEQIASGAVEQAMPRDELESILVEVWRKVLAVEVIGIHDDYFVAGGDSIRVIQLVHELAEYGLSVTAMDVFRQRTINNLARYVRELKVSGENTLPPLELLSLPDAFTARLGNDSDIEDAYPLAQGQEFVIHHYASDQQRMGVYHIQQSYHVYDRELSVAALQRALEIVVDSHPALRTTFIFDRGTRPVQVVHKHLPVSIHQEDLSDLDPLKQDEYIARALEQDRSHLFDVKQPSQPLFRFTLFRRSETSAEFLMSFHHAIMDGWGNQQLLNELAELYAALKRGETKPPAGGANTYKEFVALEHEIVSSIAAADFWRDHLSEHRWRPLPSRAAADDRNAETNLIVALPRELLAQLKRASREQSVSLKSLFLSAYLDLIAGVTDRAQNTVGVVSNGRSERLSNPLKALGLFWNIIPFCCPVRIDNRLSQVRRVQQLLIEAELYARYPLLQILNERQASELFSATFNFLHFHNMKGDKFDSGFQLLGERVHDKFHFPLNYLVSVDPFNENIGIRMEYDQQYFDSEAITAMSDDYLARLREDT